MRALALALLALLCGPARADDPGAFAYEQRLGDTVPLGTQLRNENGRLVDLAMVMAGRPTIIALGYFHCPNLCGLVRADLMNALAGSGLDGRRDYSLVVLSIDPSETPADARAARAEDVARFDHPDQTGDWHYLTGSAPAVAAVTQAVGFRSRFDPDAKQFLHPAGLVFLTDRGVVSGYLLGLGYQPGDLRLGVARAAQSLTARALPILLLCFHFDPSTGRYTFAVMRAVQLGGAITILVVAGTIALALRRERRAR